MSFEVCFRLLHAFQDLLVNLQCLGLLAGSLVALPKQVDTGIDSAGSASTVVLREVHCALLRIIQSQGVERDKRDVAKGQPTTAKLFSPDSSGPVPWTAQVAQAILAAPAATTAATAKVKLPFSCCACFPASLPPATDRMCRLDSLHRILTVA